MKNFFRQAGIFTAALLVLTLLPRVGQTQEAQQESQAAPVVSYEGQKVSSVQLAGQPDGNLKKLRSLIAQPVNAPYTQANIDRTIEALKQAGNFEKIEVQVEPSADGLHVLFIMQPAALRFDRRRRVCYIQKFRNEFVRPLCGPVTAGGGGPD